MNISLTQDKFLKDVATHIMQPMRDDGVYRHIRFRRPDSMCMHFDLITWPGYICYCGDMGTFVFSRLDDMFQFFRTDRCDDGQLRINLSYWSEKLRAVDGNRMNGSAMVFDEERYIQVVKEKLVTWMREECKNAEERRELREAVEEELLGGGLFNDIPGSAAEAVRMASDFSEKIGEKTYRFIDFWDHRLETYSYHFIWCCYALAWGIQKYDEAKASVLGDEGGAA